MHAISKIGGFESTVLGTGLRDIRSPNQYKINRVLWGRVESDKQQIIAKGRKNT